MRGVWTAQQVRDAEAVLLGRTPEGTLMRRAAFGVAVHARRMLARIGPVAGRRVALLVGAGNNGGDALWAGYELRRRGVGVTAVLLDPARAHPAGLAALRRAGGRFVDAEAGLVAELGADLVIDGIVGISGKGALREPAARLVAAVEHAGVPVLAVDLPSGVDPDTGEATGPAVTATETVTFGALKPVHVLAAPRCGPVHLVDIGLGPLLPEPHAHVLDAEDVGRRWPVPGPADDKYTQGVVGIAAGSAAYPGAAVLATGAAVLATSGMVRFAGSAAPGVRATWPETVITESIHEADRTQAWAVGPGIGTDEAGRAVLAEAIARDVPLCIDADGITLLAEDEELRAALRGRPVVITPHDREFARIAGEVGSDRVGAARRAAAALDVTVLLKGNATVVAAPDGRVLVNPAASSWAATAGSGDVLTGVIGALLAAGLEPWWAAGCAARVHGLAAGLAADGAPAPASRLQAALPEAIRAVRAVGPGGGAPGTPSGPVRPPGHRPGPGRRSARRHG
jgi:ADP-dependent NAD(P)H-hydrate dehydratase / NAD(P)H-hydrate epimerase